MIPSPRFKSAANAARAIRFFNKSKSSTDVVRCIHNRSVTSLLEDFADRQHQLPPHHHATQGNQEALEDMVTSFGLTLREHDRNLSTLLHHATKANQVVMMKYLIENGVDVDAVNCNGDTALHIASREGYSQAIDILVNSGASMSIANNTKDIPLQTAAREKTGQALKALLSYPVDLQVRGYRNRTLLHTVAELDNIEGCRHLIEATARSGRGHGHGAKDKYLCHCSRDDDGLTAIHLAARKNSHQVLEFFISACRTHSAESILEFIDEENSTPLHVAVDAGNVEVVRVLLKFGACPLVIKNDIPPPLHLACSQGKLEMVKAMVHSFGIDILHEVDQNKKTPLHYSAFSIHSKSIISYIMDNGGDEVNINQQDFKGKTSLHISISSGNLSSVKELLERGADPFVKDNTGHNALHFAVLYNRTAIIQTLLEIPSSEELANEVNTKGYSPIHIGLKLAQRDIVSMLTMSVQLQLKNIKDPHGNNYIHLAASNGDWKALSAFLELSNAHKLLNETNNYGLTPLHYASKNGHLHCVEPLLNSGAMVHRCHKGMSPLMVACRDAHIECAKLLFKAYPFQIDWQDEDGDTALHYAACSGNPAMVQKILDFGAQIMQNETGRSFLDVIIEKGKEDCGLAVVNHKRWQECLDVTSPLEDDPMLGLVKQMPTIAKAVLDRSHTEEHSSNRLQQHHVETFNFKYLLTLGGKQGTSQFTTGTTMPVEDGKVRQRVTRTFSRRHKHLDEVALADMEAADADLRDMTTHRKRSTITAASSGKKRKTSQSMEVLKRMIQYKRVELLVHPVVSAYLNKKWELYGRFIYGLYFFKLVALVAALSMFVILGVPHSNSAARTNITLNENATIFEAENSTFVHAEFSTSLNVFRWLAVIFNTLSAIATVFGLILQGWKSINFVDRILVWNSVLATLLNYVFLLSPNPFNDEVLPIGAAACFFSWLVLFGALEFINVLGIYVNMFFKILRTVFQVLFACLFLLMAFALAIYMLASRVTEFSDVGFSLFSVFGYMLGEIQYSLFIKEATDGTPIQTIVIVFIVLLAIMMSIVMANLLIGLAVGDIEQIKLNALYRRRALEVGYFSTLDTHVPKCLHHIIAPKTCTVHHNENSIIKRLINHLMRLVKSEVLDKTEDMQSAEMQSTAKAPVNIAEEIVQIKQKLKELSDMMHNYQEGEKVDHRKRRQSLRWQKPQFGMSIDSSDTDITCTMNASDFLDDLA